ncbi:MAG: T9SS type A sorting domain-containing protein [Ignavibacteria bacterium]|nr:T9SS type A sorting domain-containing protein [Ignavibacteria bacterium]
MKTIGFFIVLCSLLIINCYGQSITWQKLYPVEGDNRSVSKATCMADDGNFYSGGTAFLSGNWRIFVMKINPYGDTIWTKRIDTLGTEVFAMASSGDGGCVITGDNNYSIKLNSSGNIIWAKYYGGVGIELYDIIKTTDGGYVACGQLFDINNFTNNGYIFKLDNNGNLQWEKIYLSNNSKILLSIIELNDNKFITTGGNIDFPGDTGKAILLKVNSIGDTIWQKKYTAFNKPIAGHVISKINGMYIVGGATTDSSGSYSNTFFMRVDTTGNLLYAKKFEANGNQGFYDLKVLNANKYVFTRTRATGITLDSYGMIIDSLGNEIIGKSFALPLFVIFRSILLMPNGDFIFAGNGNNSQQSEYDTYIVRTDSLLFAPPISIINNISSLPDSYILKQNYPNPFNPTTTIEIYMKVSANVEIKIFDVTGKYIKSPHIGRLNAGTHIVAFDGEYYASGVYFYSMLVDERMTETKKMILVR